MSSREEMASEFFHCSEGERVAFEAGIKLGTIYHQFVGTPVASSNVDSLERAIEEGVMVQPFVEDVKVTINRSMLRKKRNEFDYQTLTGNMMEVRLTIQIDDVEAVAEMSYISELKYPLMFIRKISKIE